MRVFDISNRFLSINREILVILGREPDPEYTNLIFDHLRPDLSGCYLGWSRWVRTDDGKIDIIPLDDNAIFRE